MWSQVSFSKFCWPSGCLHRSERGWSVRKAVRKRIGSHKQTQRAEVCPDPAPTVLVRFRISVDKALYRRFWPCWQGASQDASRRRQRLTLRRRETPPRGEGQKRAILSGGPGIGRGIALFRAGRASGTLLPSDQSVCRTAWVTVHDRGGLHGRYSGAAICKKPKTQNSIKTLTATYPIAFAHFRRNSGKTSPAIKRPKVLFTPCALAKSFDGLGAPSHSDTLNKLKMTFACQKNATPKATTAFANSKDTMATTTTDMKTY